MLSTLCNIFRNYTDFSNGSNAFSFIIIHRFGNYVVQKLIDVAIDVFNGKRDGERAWLEHLKYCAYVHQPVLSRLCSGRKILNKLATIDE